MYACAPHHVVPIEAREGARSLDTELQTNVSHGVTVSKHSQPLSHQEQQSKNI